MLEVKLEDQQLIYLRNSSIIHVNFAFQAFLKVRRSIKWFLLKNSVRFVRMRRLKDLDMSHKTLYHCTCLWFSTLFSLLRLAKQINANSTHV